MTTMIGSLTIVGYYSCSNSIFTFLDQISNAFNPGCKYIIQEASTGFGKSPVAIAVALSCGSSYNCTSTKDLQTQYSNDFPYLKIAKVTICSL
jgi:Rad3-related DNA helicase